MNLFERLYRYREKASKHERENYLTELLAAVLERNPDFCHRLCEYAGVPMSTGTPFRVRTQVSYPTGRPDVVLDSPAAGLFLLIECKLEAGEGAGQLLNYQEIAQESQAQHWAILFLTKYYEPPRELARVAQLRWYELFRFVQQLPSPLSEVTTLFSEYLTHHRLHQSMAFTSADLLALEQIAATTAKMDEVLFDVEWLFRDQLGGTYQHTKSRSAHLAEGWYGYWRHLHGITYSAGFRGQGPGEIPHCFVAAKSWNGSLESAPITTFQQALRTAWGVASQPLDDLMVSQSLVKLLASDTEVNPLEAMRAWFKKQFVTLNDTLVLHPHMLHGHTEPDLTAQAEATEIGDDQLGTTLLVPTPNKLT